MKWLLFVVLTVICWGAYVPAVHEGQSAIGGSKDTRALWAFLCVGIAYFLTAVLVPVVMLVSRGELTSFPPTRGAAISSLAGVLGAVGALGVILALMSGGRPTTVPPLVFAGAPIVATLIAMLLHRPERMPDWPFYVGLIMAASGAALVLRFKPS